MVNALWLQQYFYVACCLINWFTITYMKVSLFCIFKMYVYVCYRALEFSLVSSFYQEYACRVFLKSALLDFSSLRFCLFLMVVTIRQTRNSTNKALLIAKMMMPS